MTPRLPMLLSLVLLPVAASAQQIPLKTAPIATGDQFFLLPSRGAGMGGLTLAVRDTLGDPWGNPALGGRLRGGELFVVPSGYTISDDIGAGVSFAVGGTARLGAWFAGGAVALQQLHNPDRGNLFVDWPETDRFIDDALGNDYVHVFAGRRLGPRTSVGVSVFRAGLTAVEGVSQLYPGSQRIRQDGDLTDLRLGALHELPNGGALEAVVMHSRLNMRHDVGYFDWVWLPADPEPLPPMPAGRIEENLDRTRTTGLRVAWETPVEQAPGTTLGLALTANRKQHPKIPNYEIANIPRDPGNSTVFALEAGVARTLGPSTVGLELAWKPGRSHTWAEADGPIPLPGGGTIPEGGRTVENWFHFSNLRVATGYERDTGGWAMRIGFDVELYRYSLDQERHVEGTRRETDEHWFEWSPTWGVAFRPAGFSLEYTGRLVAKGFPDLFGDGGEVLVAVPDSPIDFLPAPTEPASLPDFAQWTHQVAIRVPLG